MVQSQHSGSPPHTRGKVCCTRCRASSQGITPAHAGKSTALALVLVMIEDHPRTRGEKVDAVESVENGRGITPAHAGKRLKNPVKSPFIMLF